MLPKLRLHATTQFLLQHVCASTTRAAGDIAVLPFSADELLAEARFQNITGLLYRWVKAQAGSSLIDTLARHLAPLQQIHAIGALKLVDETTRLVALLQSKGICNVVLKGPLLSKRYYGGFAARHAGDVDVLVDEANAAQADQLMREAGYRRTKPRHLLQCSRKKLYFDTQHEFGYVSPDGITPIELHWRFADCRQLSPLLFADFYAATEVMSVGGRTLRTLSPVHTFIQLAIHGALDGYSRLKWHADLPRVHAALQPQDLAQLGTLAAATGLTRIVDLALLLAGQACRDDHGLRWQLHAARHISLRLGRPCLAPPSPAAQLRRFIEGYQYLFALCENSRIKPALVHANLIMPRDFDTLLLPDALTGLLPYLAQCQRGIGRFREGL